jgi:hypothetical protein
MNNLVGSRILFERPCIAWAIASLNIAGIITNIARSHTRVSKRLVIKDYLMMALKLSCLFPKLLAEMRPLSLQTCLD